MHADATLTWEPTSKGRDSDATENKAQSDFRTDNGLSGSDDQVGHIFAYRFVNGHGPVNMFPQYGKLNTGPYAQMESEWGDWLAKGMEVRIDTTLAPAEVQRPDRIRVDYEVVNPASGKVVYDPVVIVYQNAAGQHFDRVAKTEMDRLIDQANA